MTVDIIAATTANDLGVALAAERRYADAIPHYLEARRLYPDWSSPWFNLGIASVRWSTCLDARIGSGDM
jgi:hypothetical protein